MTLVGQALSTEFTFVIGKTKLFITLEKAKPSDLCPTKTHMDFWGIFLPSPSKSINLNTVKYSVKFQKQSTQKAL